MPSTRGTTTTDEEKMRTSISAVSLLVKFTDDHFLLTYQNHGERIITMRCNQSIVLYYAIVVGE